MPGKNVVGYTVAQRAVNLPAAEETDEGDRDGTLPTNNSRWDAPSHPPGTDGVRMLEKCPKHCHFVPLFCAHCAARSRRGWLGKSLLHHEIGHDVRAAGLSRN
jgi:hypothetical protein